MTETTIRVASALLGPDYRASGPVGNHRRRLADRRDRARDRGGVRPEAAGVAVALRCAQPCTAAVDHLLRRRAEALGDLAAEPCDHSARRSLYRRRRVLCAVAGGGCTSVMVHLTRPMGGRPLPEEAREIARAAQDVGISIGFAVAMRDRNPLGLWRPRAGPRPDARGRAGRGKGDLARPHGPRRRPACDGRCSGRCGRRSARPCGCAIRPERRAMVLPRACFEAIAEASARTGRRIHMHLLETKPQRDWADAAHPEGIVAMLDGIGLLSERLTLAHCAWARPEELALIAGSGARVAVNGSSNLHLFSGLARVPDMLSGGRSPWQWASTACAFERMTKRAAGDAAVAPAAPCAGLRRRGA